MLLNFWRGEFNMQSGDREFIRHFKTQWFTWWHGSPRKAIKLDGGEFDDEDYISEIKDFVGIGFTEEVSELVSKINEFQKYWTETDFGETFPQGDPFFNFLWSFASRNRQLVEYDINPVYLKTLPGLAKRSGRHFALSSLFESYPIIGKTFFDKPQETKPVMEIEGITEHTIFRYEEPPKVHYTLDLNKGKLNVQSSAYGDFLYNSATNFLRDHPELVKEEEPAEVS